MVEHSLFSRFGTLVDGRTGEAYDRDKFRSRVEHKKSLFENMVAPGDFVVFKLSNQPDFFVTLFACWEMQLVPVILPHRSSQSEAENVRDFFGAGAVFHDKSFDFGGARGPAKLKVPANVRASTALVLLTSGTLKDPKAIFLSFDALKEKFAALEREIPLEQRRNTMCFLPLCFGHGLICNSLFPLLNGSTLYIYPAFELNMTGEYLEAIEKYQIQFLSTVPVILKVLSQHRLPKNRQLRRVHCASAPLRLQDWQAADRWLENLNVTHVYGLTEFAGWVAGTNGIEHQAPGFVGRPWGVEFKIESGQICLRGAGGMSGYVDQGKFHPVDGKSWFSTGDSGFLGPHGLTLEGRIKDIINYGGFKVHPDDLEQLISQHPLVKEVCCFGLANENLGEVPAAACVLNGPLTEKELKVWCLERIHANKVPARWFFIDELPRSERGKVSRHKVRDFCASVDKPVQR